MSAIAFWCAPGSPGARWSGISKIARNASINASAACLLGSLMVATMMVHGALAGDYEAASAAAKNGDFSRAVVLLKSLAEKGDTKAQSELGGLYLAGKGVQANPSEGVRWIRAAAEKGVAAAQFNLGSLYLEGHVLPVDYKAAMTWLLKAAAQNVPEAQLNIASMYFDGEGVPQDYAEAGKWLRLAAANGNADAQVALARLYAHGQGVEKNPLRAFMWGEIAAEKSPMSESEEKTIREMAEKALTPEELQQARTMLKKCKDSGLKECF